jgi:hypothetical protein
VNEAFANYLGLAKDDPLRLGVETDVPWDAHIQLIHPDDHEETLRVGATCIRASRRRHDARHPRFYARCKNQASWNQQVSMQAQIAVARAAHGKLLKFLFRQVTGQAIVVDGRQYRIG